MRKKALILLLFILCAFIVNADELEDAVNGGYEIPEIIEPGIKPSQDFFFGIGGGASLYSAYGFAYGGGLTIGYGTGSALGANITWFFSTDDVDTLEINLFLRFYLFGVNAYSGPFLYIMGGPVIYYQRGHLHLPGYIGSVSGGLGFGWRFLLKNRFYIEPYVRGGYPYLFGGGISIGIRG